MDISPVQNLNINPNLKFTHKNKHQVIKPHQADLNHKKNNLKVRLGVFATTLLGVASALAIIWLFLKFIIRKDLTIKNLILKRVKSF